jgi:hypothetical protein
VELDALAAGEPQRAVAEVVGQAVQGEVLVGRQLPAGDLAADHEHVELADPRLGPVLARIPVLLLVGAVELQQVLVAVAEVVGVLRQLLGHAAAEIAAGLLGHFHAGPFRARARRHVGHVQTFRPKDRRVNLYQINRQC